MATKTRVAIVLSGGSSLGSYIAGALDELMHALSAASDRYEIDIITGTSAGATTAAVLAHGLLFRNGKTRLHDVWVDQLDMVELMGADAPSEPQLTLLSGRQLRDIALQTRTWDSPNEGARRAPFCADTLTVAMTMANTMALPYVSRVTQPAAGRREGFVELRHAEQETFLFNTGAQPTDTPVWERISNVALASAAIPLVFPQVCLEREMKDPRQYTQTPAFDGTDGTAKFWYVDGGLFNNLPVDLAWYYACQNTPPHEDPLDQRVIIVVDPSRNDIQPVERNPRRAPVVEHLFQLMSAVKQESGAIQFANEVVMRSQLAHGNAGTRGRALPVKDFPGIPQAPVELLNNFALVMPLKSDPRLRGSHLQSLGAFLDRRFREYDFRRGASDTRQVATQVLGIQESYAGRNPDFYEPDKDPELTVDISRYGFLQNIPSTRDPQKNVQQVFEDALDARIEMLVKKWDAPGPDFLVDPVFNHFLKQFAHENLPGLWNQ